MEEMTVTEALAEVKLTLKKVQTKRDFVKAHVAQMSNVVDPMGDSGGSKKVIQQEMQAIKDLTERQVRIRSVIHQANAGTPLRIGAQERSVADWLVWRREVAEVELQYLRDIQNHVSAWRKEAASKGITVASPDSGAVNQNTFVNVFLSERKLQEQIEETQNTLAALDGKLSLHNATVRVKF